jgi:hypothetical protein
VSPDPVIRMSSAMQWVPVSPDNAAANRAENNSGEGEVPNGSFSHLYLPRGAHACEHGTGVVQNTMEETFTAIN